MTSPETSTFCRKTVRLLLSALFLALAVPTLQAQESPAAEKAVLKVAQTYEKLGFDFRADIWVRELVPSMGKAVRVQLFKGNEYRVCLAVPAKSGVQIAAHVLDATGKPVESKVETVDDGWGVTLFVEPKKTGIYMVVVRHAGGPTKPAMVAMINGYK